MVGYALWVDKFPKYFHEVDGPFGFKGLKVDLEKVKVVQSWPTKNIVGDVRSFKWEESHDRAFQALKERFANAHILALPNISKAIELECDASNVGELYTLVRTLQVWQQYLLSKEFVVHSYHEALKHLRSQSPPNPSSATLLVMSSSHAKWVELLEQLPFHKT
ncbi:hypothetical protein CR513_28877, partial [Mucuna pruriens]